MTIIKKLSRSELSVEVENIQNDLEALFELETEIIGTCTIYNSLSSTQCANNPLYGNISDSWGGLLNQNYFTHRRNVVAVLKELLSLTGEVKYDALINFDKIKNTIQFHAPLDYLGLSYSLNEFLETHFCGQNRHSNRLSFGSECAVDIEGVLTVVAPLYTAKFQNLVNSFKGVDIRALPLVPKFSDALYHFESEDFELKFNQCFSEQDDAVVNIQLFVKNKDVLNYLAIEVDKINKENTK